MAPKIIKKILVLLHLRQPEVEKYDYDAHMHLEVQGFYNEGLEGVYKCPSKRCKNTVSVYRQVRRQIHNFHDVLRFEQTISVLPSSKTKPALKGSNIKPTLPGKCSKSVPVVWNGENRKAVGEKEYVGEKKSADGKTYVLVKHKFFTSVTCVACKKDMHLWDELRKYEGEEEMRWFLARKEGNLSKKDIEGGGSEAETLVDF